MIDNILAERALKLIKKYVHLFAYDAAKREDLIQEACITFLQKYKFYKPDKSPLEAYIRMLVRHTIQDYNGSSAANSVFKTRHTTESRNIYRALKKTCHSNTTHSELTQLAEELNIPAPALLQKYNALFGVVRLDISDNSAHELVASDQYDITLSTSTSNTLLKTLNTLSPQESTTLRNFLVGKTYNSKILAGIVDKCRAALKLDL